MVIVLREFLGDEVHTVKALQIALQEIAGACNEMLDAFIVLQTFRSRLISELRDATDAVGRSYLRIFASLQVLIGVTRIAAPNVDSLSADRAAYYDGIVQHLFETFRLERNEPANP